MVETWDSGGGTEEKSGRGVAGGRQGLWYGGRPEDACE